MCEIFPYQKIGENFWKCDVESLTFGSRVVWRPVKVEHSFLLLGFQSTFVRGVGVWYRISNSGSHEGKESVVAKKYTLSPEVGDLKVGVLEAGCFDIGEFETKNSIFGRFACWHF
jgi:hypothetical protein